MNEHRLAGVNSRHQEDASNDLGHLGRSFSLVTTPPDAQVG